LLWYLGKFPLQGALLDLKQYNDTVTENGGHTIDEGVGQQQNTKQVNILYQPEFKIRYCRCHFFSLLV